MGFLSRLFGNDDKPSPLEKQRESWGTGPSPEILRRHRAQPLKTQPTDTRPRTNTPALATWSDPTQATRPTQRYLRAAGWNGTAPAAAASTGSTWVDPATFQGVGRHQYRLSPWQQEQADLEYGVGIPKEDLQLTGDLFRTAKMNAADYETLTPQQKNAVRFNQMLIAATQADRQSAVPPEAQDSEYQSRVEEMFGTQGGSEVYAPNTLNLLEKMGMGRLRGQDLDEYLSLDRAYDVNEIQALQPWEAAPELPGYTGFSQARNLETQGILDQRQVDMAGSLIEQALADTSIRGWNEDARIAQYIGNRPPVEQIPFGWLLQGETRGDPLLDRKEMEFQDLYTFLSSDTTEGLDAIWEMGDMYKFTDADYNELFDYFHLRSLEDDRTGVPAGFRTGQQTRDFIGIGG